MQRRTECPDKPSGRLRQVAGRAAVRNETDRVTTGACVDHGAEQQLRVPVDTAAVAAVANGS